MQQTLYRNEIFRHFRLQIYAVISKDTVKFGHKIGHKMDWFLYDNGLRHERVKWLIVALTVVVHNNRKAKAT